VIWAEFITEGRDRAWARVTPTSMTATEARNVLRERSADCPRWALSRRLKFVATPRYTHSEPLNHAYTPGENGISPRRNEALACLGAATTSTQSIACNCRLRIDDLRLDKKRRCLAGIGQVWCVTLPNAQPNTVFRATLEQRL
jgi:hypothetical protein